MLSEYIDFYYVIKEAHSTKTKKQTLYDVLKQHFEATGKITEQLRNPPVVPFEIAHIWEWFEKLNVKRVSSVGVSGAIPHHIQYAESWAFFDLYQIKPHARELEWLEKIDRLYLKLTRQEVVK